MEGFSFPKNDITKETNMQLKLKTLKIIQFALREFKQDSGILFSITHELIERELLKHEAAL